MSRSSKRPGSALRVGLISVISGFALSFISTLASAEYGLNFKKPVTAIAHEVHDLHMLIMMVCVGIGIVVFGAMFWSIFMHRKSRGAKAATFHESTTIEIIWTAIPFLILVSMAIPSTATLIKMEDTKNADLVIKVTGYQWKWQYEYLDQDISFISSLASTSNIARQLNSGITPESVDNYLLDVDHPLVLPVGRKIKFLITADDVIHSWWVPALGWKRDAIPGFINEAWTNIDKPGTYRGQCAELCGKDHGFMPIVVIALAENEFDSWVNQQLAKKPQSDQ